LVHLFQFLARPSPTQLKPARKFIGPSSLRLAYVDGCFDFHTWSFALLLSTASDGSSTVIIKIEPVIGGRKTPFTIFVLARLSLFCFYGAPEFGVFAAFLSVVSLILLSPLHYN
jgi:hypothetical protein